jgi:uncharacterized membrane protein YoaK (UPF0700 family)
VHVAGIVIGHMLRCHPKPERWRLKLYIPMLLGFVFGAAGCAKSYIHHGQAALLFPTFFSGTTISNM